MFRHALAAAGLGFWERDEHGRTVWSAEMYVLLGYDPYCVEPCTEAFWRRVHPDDVAVRTAAYEDALRERRDFKTEYRVIWPNGDVHWLQGRGRFTFDEAGNLKSTAGVIIDIDHQKRTENDLREAHARLSSLADQLRSVAEATPGTLFTFRQPREGRPEYLFVGPHLRETHGFSPKDLAADPLLLLKHMHPEDVDNFLAETQESAKTLTMWHSQFRHIHPVKGEVWIEIFAHPVADQGGVTWHGIAHDITEHKRIEADLRAARAKAEAADRSKSEFLANMSHEIRTPMSAILGFADVLRGRLTNSQSLEYLNTICSNGEYLLKIIDDILDLSRIEAGKLEVRVEPVRPAELMREVQSLMRLPAQQKGLALDLALDSDVPQMIATDRRRLRQILINLVSNAVKFTTQGSVRLGVRSGSDNRLCFDVSDTGIGIRADLLDTLFTPFTQGDSSLTRPFSGSGLGLSICRALSHELGGEVTVTSREGAGSTFTLTIPISELQPVAADPDTDAADTPSTTRPPSLACRVLVVDDHPDMRSLARLILEAAGADVALATQGEEALFLATAADSRAEPFDAVLLDVQMPIRDGYSTARELRRRGYTGAIIAVTAHARKEDELRCRASGCDEYFSKPLDRKRLIEAVSRLSQG